jgi:hypothetical protein
MAYSPEIPHVSRASRTHADVDGEDVLEEPGQGCLDGSKGGAR